MANQTERPNILLIMSDQHRRDAMGFVDPARATTPTLDRLASEGMAFDNFYTNSPICLPARMSFLTGQHPCETETWTNHDALCSQTPTFAHSLGAAGYETVLSGRMHIVGPDQHHGFEQRPVGDFRATWLWGGWDLEPVLGMLKDTPGMNRASMEKSGPGASGYMEYDERIRDVTVDWIRNRGERADEDRPFCLVAGFVAPHCPFVCPQEYFDKHYETMDAPTIPEGFFDHTLHPVHRQMRAKFRIEDLTETEIRRTRAAYYGLVEWFDTLVGDVLSALEKSGLADNTIVIYTSDHGDQLGDHGMWWKSTFYESSAGVPFLIRWPAEIQGGTRSAATASLMDVGPTLLDIAGASALPNASGRSFLPLLRGDDTAWTDEVISEFAADGMPPRRMVRRGPWKLTVFDGHDPELYHLDEDPGEFTNRSTDPDCQDIVRELSQRAREGWDPEGVRNRKHKHDQDRRLLGDWVRATKPYDPYGWPKPGDRPPQNYVDPVE